MSNQVQNTDVPEEELSSSSGVFQIPCALKALVTVISFLLISASVYLVCNYIEAPKTAPSPKDLGLSSILIFSFTALILVWIPWDKLGIRITKIGGIEFEDIVAEQASEHAEDLSYLEDRVEALEEHLRNTDELMKIAEKFSEPQLRGILLQFLTEYKQWAFSPSRIRAWGAKQPGYSELSKYNHQFIRSTLQKMVSENILETRISKKGNTLYRILI